MLVGGVGGPPRPLVRRSGGDGLPLLPPGLVPGGTRRFRMAWAPKLMRRVKGVVGAVREAGSSSSMAFSSMESELVEILPRRILKGVLTVVGDVPDSPMVEMERRRRCWSFMGKVGAVVAVDPLLWNRLVSGLLTELRRWRGMSAEGPLLELSVDIVAGRVVQELLDISLFLLFRWRE